MDERVSAAFKYCLAYAQSPNVFVTPTFMYMPDTSMMHGISEACHRPTT